MIRISCVDAFASRPFAGNPAGVCILDGRRRPEWMAGVAREIALPETAFITPSEGRFSLRWFTRGGVEVDLCGHATLAAAHLIWEKGIVEPELPIRFASKSGTLTAKKAGRTIWLDFPALPFEEAATPAGLPEALGVVPAFTLASRFDLCIGLDSGEAVSTLHPDFAALAKIPVRGVIVTARSEGMEYDFISRFFAPAIGVNEDPVTGSAHCCLGPYWGGRLKKTDLVAFQASERGGIVRMRLSGGDRVAIGGRAVTIWNGTLAV